MRTKMDVQVIRQMDEVILEVKCDFPKMTIRSYMHPVAAKALGEVLIAASEE